ncbi:hypothetical protein [Aurantimonas sp. Leaf443]|uniref:hypothetical protein n=1 Tax=Aurantimonas sp. Leaf443 TaxID=1736378 RepID=UPI0006F63FF0|nr:hypothetical protein [Aurantimonas sp. Leaf443]KQT82478.1 hypothetical protein ASG48_15505 [Aurantimonas sp. Leaf443]
MEHVAAFMLLVGCSGNLQSCNEIPVPVPAYETLADCQEDLPLQIRLSSDSSQRVLGACKGVAPDVFERSASIDWTITRDGRLSIDFTSEPQIVAAR